MEKSIYNKSIAKTIEYYLYNYDAIDYKIYLLKGDLEYYNYRQTYNAWIKRQGSLEDDAIKNIEIERKILKLQKWKRIINLTLEEYKRKDKIKYKFICLKYFRKVKPIKIKYKLNLDFKEQLNIRKEILNYIVVTIKNKRIGGNSEVTNDKKNYC